MLIFRCTVQTINGIDNATTAGGPTPKIKLEFETFCYLSKMIRELQLQRNFELVFSRKEQLQITPLELRDISEATALSAIEKAPRLRYRFNSLSWLLVLH